MPTTGKKHYFPCECWLGKDKEDGKTVRIFSVDETREVAYKPKIPWELSVYTGDVQNAGTDSPISMTLFGVDGKSEVMQLDKGEDRFERNGVDFINLNIEDVGAPRKIRIGHTGKGSRPHWYLEKLLLRNMTNDQLIIFNCDKWYSFSFKIFLFL